MSDQPPPESVDGGGNAAGDPQPVGLSPRLLPSRVYAPPIVVRYGNQLAVAGLVFVGLAFFCIAAVVIKILLSSWAYAQGPDTAAAVLLDLFRQLGPNLLLIVTGFLSALIGRALLTAGQRSNYSSLPEKDFEVLRQAITDGKSDPIDQYIRLRALSGFTGGFTKIGLTGLPLVTIGVTMIFTLCALLFVQNEKVFTSLFDLAKLTLGAFIGSYVQRQVERRRQEGEGASATPPRPPLPT